MITRGHFVLADFVSMKSECIQTYRTEDLVQRWLSVMVQLCQAMNVTADVQKDTEVTLFEDSVSFSLNDAAFFFLILSHDLCTGSGHLVM